MPVPCCRAGKRRLVSQFNDLQRCYLRLRNEQLGHGQAGGQPSSSLEPPGPSPLPHAKRKRGFEEASDLAASSADMHAHAAEAVQRVGPVGTLGGLHEFARMLSTFTRCSKLKVRISGWYPFWVRVCAAWMLSHAGYRCPRWQQSLDDCLDIRQSMKGLAGQMSRG